MRIICSICREVFTPDSKINATKCGHLYHMHCLGKWCEKRTTCPQCRSPIWQRTQQVQFLFREVPDDKVVSTSYEELVHDYEVIRQEENELRAKNKELSLIQSNLKHKIKECKAKIKNYEFDIAVWEKQCNIYGQVPDIQSQLMKENEEMTEKINLLKKLHKLINGTEDEMHEILSGMPTNAATIKELCTFVQAMKYELKISEDYYKRKYENIYSIEECTHEATRQNNNDNKENKEKTFVDKAVQTDTKKIKKFGRKLLKKPVLKLVKESTAHYNTFQK